MNGRCDVNKPIKSQLEPVFPTQTRANLRMVLAGASDRASLAAGPLAHLVTYTDEVFGSDGTMRNVYPVLAVVASSAGAKEIEAASAALAKLATVPAPPVIRIDRDVEGVAALVQTVLESGLGRISSYAQTMSTELVMLRRERETLFENFRVLEDAFRARNWEPASEIFAHDPFVDPKDEGIGRLMRESWVEQLLPVSSFGVSGFALHFRHVAKGSGEVIVTLDYVESGEGVAEWIVPFSDLAADWNFFSLPKACDGSPRTLRLRVSANGAEPPAPSLGHPIASRRYAARSRSLHGDLDHRPLAIKIYSGVPGVRPTALPNSIAPSALMSGRRIEDYRLPLDALRAVADVSVSPIVPDFQTIRFLEHEDAIVCHPLPAGISAGAIVNVVAPGTVRFAARAMIDHPEGKPALVGFLLAPSAANLRSEIAVLEREGTARRSAYFSGWRDVAAGEAVSINIMLDTPTQRMMNLVILSRAKGDSVDFSWLKVFDFRLVRHFDVEPRGETAHAQ